MAKRMDWQKASDRDRVRRNGEPLDGSGEEWRAGLPRTNHLKPLPCYRVLPDGRRVPLNFAAYSLRRPPK
jgi:hypothetical protein